MSWNQYGNKNRSPFTSTRQLYVVAALLATLVIGLILMVGYLTREEEQPVTTAGNVFTTTTTPDSEGPGVAAEIPTETTRPPIPYVAPPTIVAAPVVPTTAPVPGAPPSPEARVQPPSYLAQIYNQRLSRLSPAVYTDASNRAADVVASFLRGDARQRYPNYFISFPTLTEWKLQYATAAVPERVQDRNMIRTSVWWEGTPVSGPRILQGTTVIYMKPGTLEPIDPLDLPEELRAADSAVTNNYIDAS